MKSKIITGLFSTVVLVTLGLTVQAAPMTSEERDAKRVEMESIRTDRQDAIQEKKDEIEAKKEERIEGKCEKAENKIQERIKTLENNQANRKNAYGQVENKITNLITNLKAEGHDVSDVEKAFDEFKAQLETFYDAHTATMTQLKATENYDCGNSEGEFKGQVKKAREQMRIAHQERMTLRKQFVEELRPALLQLRNQIKTESSETEDVEEVEAE